MCRQSGEMGNKDPIHVKALERDGGFFRAILEAELDCQDNRTAASLNTFKYDFLSQHTPPCRLMHHNTNPNAYPEVLLHTCHPVL